VLLLTEVLGWPAIEVAEALEFTVPAVNSALQRARATLASRNLKEAGDPLTDAQSKLVDRYLDAFVRYDVPALVALLHHDATLSMPPYTLWLQGHAPISTWLSGRGDGCRGSRLIPTLANGLPAFGQYRIDPNGGFAPWALLVVELRGDRIASMCSFLDTQSLFPRFGLPAHLPN
jgi:RNA polymerase sigma-70 factor, ECF subfamily